MEATMADVITGRSKLLFHLPMVDHDGMSTSQNMRSDNANFIKVGTFIKNALVVNDPAKRAIKLIENFATKVTKRENQREMLLQSVENCRSVPR